MAVSGDKWQKLEKVAVGREGTRQSVVLVEYCSVMLALSD